jgi:hypothetical protein
MLTRIPMAVLLATATAFSQASAPDSPEIRGVVLEPGTNQPVASAEIALFTQTGDKVKRNGGWKSEPERKTRSDSDGTFHFAPETTGAYRVEASRPGFLDPGLPTPAYSEIGLTDAKPVAEVKLYLVQPGRLTGTVIDEDTRKPIAGLKLLAVRREPRMDTFVPAGKAVATSTTGEFEIAGLSPGDYLVEVRPASGTGDSAKRVLPHLPAEADRTPDRDWEHTYWPGGHGLEHALPVSLGSGAAIHIGRITVRKVAYFHVRLRLSEEQCRAGDDLFVYELTRFGRSGISSRQLGNVACGRELFVTGFSPGDYQLNLAARSHDGELRTSGSVFFTMVDRDLDLVAPLFASVAVEGKFVAEDGTKLPDLSHTSVTIGPADRNSYSMDEGAPATVDGDVFRKTGVRIAEHTIEVRGLDQGHYVKRIRYNGAAVAGNSLTLDANAATHTLTIVIDDKPATIMGTVMKAEKPVAGARIVAVKWPMPASPGLSDTRAATSDATGHFQLAGLTPGDYHVMAVSMASRDTWDERAYQAALAAAPKTELTVGAMVTLSLTVP